MFYFSHPIIHQVANLSWSRFFKKKKILLAPSPKRGKGLGCPRGQGSLLWLEMVSNSRVIAPPGTEGSFFLEKKEQAGGSHEDNPSPPPPQFPKTALET